MRLLIVDDHEIYREGLKQVLLRCEELEVVAEAPHARAAFPLVDKHHPDLVLMDMVLPGMDGSMATREIRQRAPVTQVLIVSMWDARADVLDALAAGASGYALKSEPASALVTAVLSVQRGEHYLAPSLAHLGAETARTADPQDVLRPLSVREREVFRLSSDGRSTAEIASELCISRKTVETHRYRILKKLNLRNLPDLIRFAAAHGLLRDRPAVRALFG
jgi:two-component system, NarL family, response regulator NreC